MTWNILIPDNVNRRAIDLLAAIPDFKVTAPGNMSRAAVLAEIGTAHALVIRSATTVDAELLAAAPHLRAVARAGVGVDNVDLAAAQARGIIVVNTPGGNTISTAEYTLALILALARHIPQGHTSLAAGNWDRKAFGGVELQGLILGIIGMGRIGRDVAARAGAFDMICIGYDPYVDAHSAHTAGIEKQDTLEQLYARADFLTLHALVTPDTRHMINATSLEQMKPGIRIINAARGALIDEAALAAALQSGHVAGAAVDVYPEEPPPADYPLLNLPNVIHTPHLSASTDGAQVRV
ncbi:MAG: hydroxyacid dehydrogenase, partial [Anaerolineaceae bacterium]|nr:hydroxyacid dehydrogenase [Anaerolineaceae bacterium]